MKKVFINNATHKLIQLKELYSVKPSVNQPLYVKDYIT